MHSLGPRRVENSMNSTRATDDDAFPWCRPSSTASRGHWVIQLLNLRGGLSSSFFAVSRSSVFSPASASASAAFNDFNFIAYSVSGMAPLPKSLRVAFLHVETVPLGTDQAVDRVVRDAPSRSLSEY